MLQFLDDPCKVKLSEKFCCLVKLLKLIRPKVLSARSPPPAYKILQFDNSFKSNSEGEAKMKLFLHKIFNSRNLERFQNDSAS